MSADATSRHEEWLQALEPSVRAEVEAEIALYKPNGVWQFEESEAEEDGEPSDVTGLSADFSSEELDSDTVAAAD